MLPVVSLIMAVLCGTVYGIEKSDTDTADPAVQAFLTDKLNNYRRTVNAKDMLEMSWDAESQALAQKLTDRCKFRLPNGDAETATFLQTKKHKCGLNMARGTGHRGWNETMALWFNGSKDFQFGVNPKKEIGHYTAMIWAKSYLFGCGFTHCTGNTGTWSSFDFFACTFCPAGNISPHEFQPYQSGQQCDSCPDACNDGLCTNPCPESNIFANCDTQLFPTGCDNLPADSGLDAYKDQCKATCQCKGKDLLY